MQTKWALHLVSQIAVFPGAGGELLIVAISLIEDYFLFGQGGGGSASSTSVAPNVSSAQGNPEFKIACLGAVSSGFLHDVFYVFFFLLKLSIKYERVINVQVITSFIVWFWP